jgi:uncharacterized protein
MEHKKTLVIGASPNHDRFSFKAVKLLLKYGHIVEAIGIKNGMIENIEIQKGLPFIPDIHTITLYIGPERQNEYYDYILNLKPKRIIFNPGTENSEFKVKAMDAGIKVVEDCTLVMLNSDRF